MFSNSHRNLRLTSLFLDETMKLIKRYFIVLSVFFIVYLLVSYKNRLFPRLVFGQFHLLSTEFNRTINFRQSQLYQHQTADGGIITLYDVTQDNEWDFQCPKSKFNEADIHDVRVCIYDPQHDEHVSGQLNDHGKWEPVVVRSFLRLLRALPNTHVIDIGANLGLYTLLATQYDRHVIAVEPLYDSLIRLHKSIQLNDVQHHVTVIANAIGIKHERLALNIVDKNLGASYLSYLDELAPPKKNIENLVEGIPPRVLAEIDTITLDDLVSIYPIFFKRAILKIDIEGFEALAFGNASILFNRTEIPAIYMEFGKLVEIKYYRGMLRKIEEMLTFLKKRNYEPYEVNDINHLLYDNWESWPWDIAFRRCDICRCPGLEKLVGSAE
jgi:FkbM family methyltransferase